MHTGVLSAMAISTLDDLQGLLGAESEAVLELQQLFKLADGYGCVLAGSPSLLCWGCLCV